MPYASLPSLDYNVKGILLNQLVPHWRQRGNVSQLFFSFLELWYNYWENFLYYGIVSMYAWGGTSWKKLNKMVFRQPNILITTYVWLVHAWCTLRTFIALIYLPIHICISIFILMNGNIWEIKREMERMGKAWGNRTKIKLDRK